mmetsp:Transcript_11862/g.21561  ORF Transcript_11862/g.21561 Transcript_11862/m.21561 type:complete len:130 (+) Transcript_11862:379-768(+)
MKELSQKFETEQSSKTVLEDTLDMFAKEIEQLKEEARLAEEQALVESTKAAEETSRLEDMNHSLSAENSKLVERCEHLETSQEKAIQTITELETVKDELQGRVDSLSEERVRNAYEVAKVNSEREQLAQ